VWQTTGLGTRMAKRVSRRQKPAELRFEAAVQLHRCAGELRRLLALMQVEDADVRSAARIVERLAADLGEQVAPSGTSH
jgi:hypothetical protein